MSKFSRQPLRAKVVLANVAFLLVPFTTFAQGLPELPPLRSNQELKDVDLLFPQRPAKEYHNSFATIQWHGESVVETGSTITVTKGTVELGDAKGDIIKLRADSIVYNRFDRTMEAIGSVHLEHSEFIMFCHRFKMKESMLDDKVTWSGEAWLVTFELPPSWVLNSNYVYFVSNEGDSLGFVGKLMGGGTAKRTTEFHFQEASVSPCPNEKNNWTAKVPFLNLKTASYSAPQMPQGYATLKNIVLKLGPVPIMWIPWALFPARVDRAPGFLPPEIGFGSQLGATIGMTYFHPLGQAADVTVSPTWYSKEGFMWDIESRWEPEITHKGDLDVRYIRPRTTMETMYRFNLREIWDLEHGWFVRADVNHTSDQMIDVEFGRNGSAMLGVPAYDSSLFIGKNFKWAAFSLSASNQRIYFYPDDPFYNDNFPASMQKIKTPEGQLRFFPVSIGNFYLDGSSRIGYFGYDLDLDDENPTAKYHWSRSDHQMRIYGKLGQIGSLRADLQVGGRVTQYGAVLEDSPFDIQTQPDNREIPTNPIDDPLFDPFRVEGASMQRWIASSRLQISMPQFGRSFLNLKLGSYSGDIKHILEPSIAFTYNSRNSRVGMFPRFDEVDIRPGVGNSMVGERSVEFGIKHHLFGRPDSLSNYSDVVRGNSTIKYYFDPVFLSDGRVKQGWSSLRTDVDVEPSKNLRLSFRRDLELSEGTSDSSISTDVNLIESFRLSMALFTSHIGLATRQRGVRTGGALKLLDGKMQFVFEVKYDIERDICAQSQVAFTYGGPCVSYSIKYYHIYLPEASLFRKEDRVDFALNLSKLGELFSFEIGQWFKRK